MSEARQTEIMKSQLDSATNAMNTVTYEHHEIHGGNHYFLCGFETEANAGTIKFGITTPDTAQWAHMTFEITSSSQAELYIHEAATYTGGATSTPINNNRNSLNTSSLVIVKDPTVTDNGTTIYSQSFGVSGTGFFGADSAGVTKREREIMFKQNTKYVIEMISRDADNIISYCGEWYEHTNK